MVAFESLGRALVLLHAAAAIVLIGATTHHLLVAVGYVRGVLRARLGRIYAATVASSYAATLVLGALAYPAFRYHTRALYLDEHAPWAANLFDMKEHLAALGLPLAAAILALSRTWTPGHTSPTRWPYLALSAALALIVWFNLFAGLAVTLERGVP